MVVYGTVKLKYSTQLLKRFTKYRFHLSLVLMMNLYYVTSACVGMLNSSSSGEHLVCEFTLVIKSLLWNFRK